MCHISKGAPPVHLRFNTKSHKESNLSHLDFFKMLWKYIYFICYFIMSLFYYFVCLYSIAYSNLFLYYISIFKAIM